MDPGSPPPSRHFEREPAAYDPGALPKEVREPTVIAWIPEARLPRATLSGNPPHTIPELYLKKSVNQP